MNRSERRRLAKTSPPDLPSAVSQAFQRYQQGDMDGAEAACRQVLRLAPDEPEATRLLGEVLIDRGRAGDAVTLLRRLTRLRPGDAGAQYSLGNACRLAGQAEAAIGPYQAAVQLGPGFAGAHHGLGAAYRALRRERDAEASFEQAVRAKPGWAMAWKDLGLMRAILGDIGGAAMALEQAVRLDPGLGEARRHLAAIQAPAAAPGLVDPAMPMSERIETLFAVGRVADRADDFDTAFRHFAQANALLRAAQQQRKIGYDPARMERDVDALIARFTAGTFADRPGDPSAQPVFILGMPRTGSTLFEQIAASHSAVRGAGEHGGIGEISRRLGWCPSPLWTGPALQDAAAGYLAEIARSAGSAPRIIDKMPDNIFQLGLIATLFPNARVIFCARDPRDTCLSCYFQHFSQPLGFDTDLADCAHRYLQTERLAAHWRAVLPLRMTTISYEALLEDMEGESRRMIEFLGLEWEPGCLEFYRTERPVRTASWAQVRRPLYARANGRWRAYREHIAPLIATFTSFCEQKEAKKL